MSYNSLYRKYRPKSFDDVIGQEHITHTLTNQITAQKVSHAYLFTGSRGTGKTTCAKIFSKAVNCLEPVNGSPCGKCETCLSLDDPSNIDILEIDAASNNKVDEIREIREKVKYMPVKGKYKAYIIDEVHMLTDSAFNALLKTLEEPPPYVIFILATTEVHKLPATILSRCLRFDFRLVSIDELEKLLISIYNKEGKKFESEAVRYICEKAEGSVRDCLSIADMCLNYSSGVLTLNDTLNLLGAADKNKITNLFLTIANGDTGKSLLAIDELASLGKSMGVIAKDLIKFTRDLLVLKTCGEILLTDTKENILKMREISGNVSVELLISIINIFSSIDSELRYSLSPRIVLETAAVRAGRLQTLDFAALSERIRRIEAGGVIMQKPAVETAQSVKAYEEEAQSEEEAEPVHLTLDNRPMDIKSIWGRMTTYFRTKGSMGLYTLVGSHSDYFVEDNTLVILANDENFLRFSEESALAEINHALFIDRCDLTAVVRKASAAIDMDKEINALKKIAGKAKINIIK